MSDIKVFKLVTGEEVVSFVKYESSSYYELETPLIVGFGYNSSLEFRPFFECGVFNTSFNIDKSKILAVVDVQDEFAKSYADTVEKIIAIYRKEETGLILPKETKKIIL